MEEQTAQSYQTFENRNQNSACLVPGKIDLMDPNDNGLLSYDDNEEDENGDTADSLMHGRQFSEISSATEMTTSNSQDTGFGSATVSEMPSPVENNDTVIKPLRDNATNKAEDESYDSPSDETTNEIEVLPNDKAIGENNVSTALNGVEDANDEKIVIDAIQDKSIELAAQKKEENYLGKFSDDKADENGKTTYSKTEDEHIEKTEQKETEDGSVEKICQKETEDESVEKICQKETEDESVEKTAQQATEDEIVEKTAQATEDENVEKTAQLGTEDKNVEKTPQQATEDENVEKTAQLGSKDENIEKTTQKETEVESFEKTKKQTTEDESIHKTVYDEPNCENIQHSLAEDDNSKKLVNDRAEEDVENAVPKETEPKNGTVETSYKVEDVEIEKTTNHNLDHKVVEYAEHEVQNGDNKKTDVPEDKHVTNAEQKEADYGDDEREAQKLAGNEDVCKAREDNIEITVADDKTENGDVEIDVSFNKTIEDSVNNAHNNLAGLENVEKVECKSLAGDNEVEDATSDKPEDKLVENGVITKTGEENVEISTHTQASDEIVANVVDKPDNECFENGTNNSAKNDNAQEDVSRKTDDKNLQSTDGDNADEKATVEEKENVMDILGNGLLKKKILVPGMGIDTRPTNGDIVTVKVDGQLPDGTCVDTGELTFGLNDGDVILAFDLAVALMEQGEKCELFTSERYAYGSLGRDPDIPKETSITYVLELVNVQKPLIVSEMSFDERLKLGEAKRERGNYLFGRADYSGAINSYNRAVKLLDNPELNEGIDEKCHCIITESWVKCYNNLAASQLKIDALDAAIKSCERVLSVQENNVKALFRLGKAYGAKGEVDQSLIYLRQAVRLDPESKLMQQEMLNQTRRKNRETATEKELYRRMLGVKPGAKPSAAEEKKAGNSNKLIKWTLVAGGVAAVLISVGLSWYRSS